MVILFFDVFVFSLSHFINTLSRINTARQGPVGFRNTVLPPATGTPLLTVARQPPLYMNADLFRASKAHSFDLEQTPCSVRFSDCDGTSQFVRISRYYPQGGVDEVVAKFASTSNQFFHLPKHFVRVAVCGGGFDATGDWPLYNCPNDGQPGTNARRDIFDGTFLRAGVGVQNKDNLLATAATVTVDFTNQPQNEFYTTKIRSGTHTFTGGLPNRMDGLQFFANYFDTTGAAPRAATVWFDGQVINMQCTPDFGVPSNCAYRTIVPVPVQTADRTVSNCRLYYFSFTDGAGVVQRYPDTGGYWTWGEGRCYQDYVPPALANTVINLRNGGTPYFPPYVPPPPPLQKPLLSDFWIVVIIASSFAFILVVALIVFCCCTRSKKSGAGSTKSKPKRRKSIGDSYIAMDKKQSSSSPKPVVTTVKQRHTTTNNNSPDYTYIESANQELLSSHDFDPPKATYKSLEDSGLSFPPIRTATLGTSTVEALEKEVPVPYVALFSYAPTTSGEIALKKGEIVFCLPGDELFEGGWAYVENDQGKAGYCPSTYIKKQ